MRTSPCPSRLRPLPAGEGIMRELRCDLRRSMACAALDSLATIWARGDALAGGGVDLKGAGQLQLLAHLPHRGDDLLAHEPQATHGVVVGHGAVAIPEED